MYKEVLEKQLEVLADMRDESKILGTTLEIAAEIRQTAEALARCEYHEMKRGMKK